MEGVAPPHCSACSFRETFERTKINEKSLNKPLTFSSVCCIIIGRE